MKNIEELRKQLAEEQHEAHALKMAYLRAKTKCEVTARQIMKVITNNQIREDQKAGY